jgi:CheY-like chemotaxis protein
MRMHHVHITEDLPRLAKMLQENLELSPQFKVTGHSLNGEALLLHLAGSGSLPDIVMMDIQMPVMDGIQATAAYLTMKKISLTPYSPEPMVICSKMNHRRCCTERCKR